LSGSSISPSRSFRDLIHALDPFKHRGIKSQSLKEPIDSEPLPSITGYTYNKGWKEGDHGGFGNGRQLTLGNRNGAVDIFIGFHQRSFPRIARIFWGGI